MKCEVCYNEKDIISSWSDENICIECFCKKFRDLLPIEKAQQVVEWFDSSPLTDEVLEGLGFEKKGMKGMEYWEYKYSDEYYLVAKRNPNYAVPYVCGIEASEKPICKTVGKVKMLIEALKGDE